LMVVYVEDDERLGRLTSRYLSSHSIDVFLVGRGDLAVAEVLRVRPHVGMGGP
jgi:DNA-binding response OmpR family regulator